MAAPVGNLAKQVCVVVVITMGFMVVPGRSATASGERFVLVHGAWHGAWTWYRVLAELEQDGHVVTALDLPSHGIDDQNPATVTMDAYVDSVLATLDDSPQPVVLVGHSLGGMVITVAAQARPDKVKLLVYAAAFLPPNGQTLLDLSGDPDSLVGPALQFGRGIVDIDRDAVNAAFYGTSPDADRALARVLLEPTPMAPFATPVFWTEQHFGSVPRAYITTLRDRTIPLAAQLSMIAATPVWRVTAIDSDHSLFFSDAAKVAEQLEDLVDNSNEDSR